MANLDILPCSLPKARKLDLSMSGRGGGNWFYLFCANCGADGGRIMETDIPDQFCFYLCDPCAEKWGSIAGTYFEPDAVFWQKVKQAQLEKYGRELSAPEVVEALKDENHLLAKLAKDRLKRR